MSGILFYSSQTAVAQPENSFQIVERLAEEQRIDFAQGKCPADRRLVVGYFACAKHNRRKRDALGRLMPGKDCIGAYGRTRSLGRKIATAVFVGNGRFAPTAPA